MKAVILAAGKGKRLRPITASRPKPMIPIAGKPLLEHTLISLKEAGINQVLLIVGYKEEMIKQYFGNGTSLGVKIEYITQNEHLGTAHATYLAKDFIDDEGAFLMMYGDLLVETKAYKEIVENFRNSKANGLVSLIEVENPREFGIISLDPSGMVEKIVEKPAEELKMGNLANAGVYIFDPQVFKAIELTKKSIRGEYELTDSIEILIRESKMTFLGFSINHRFWSDIGLPWQLLDANKYLLDNINEEILGIIEENVNISGKVFIGKDTIIKSGSTIQGPCFIGNDNSIGPNAFVRPYTFIGNKCHVGMSEIKNSIILSGSAIPHFNYVGDSIICEKVNLGAGSKISNLRFDDKSVKMCINNKIIDSERRKLGAIIGPGVKTGINTSIMCGKIIGENSWIGAHTLVLEDVDPSTIYYYDPEKGIVRKTKNK
ncbi:MAG: NTP transferase domain-containing protein [Candidatus Lokiarchaeota archaeon]|nr:NTP transferase domain-containing protein [Candidatus Lokiarchaeota archaeon]